MAYKTQRRKPTVTINEKSLATLVAHYIKTQYPSTIHRFDVGADIRLTMNQSTHVKNKLFHERGYPDLLILEMRGGYGAMFLELKKDRNEVFTKKGEYRSDKHNTEQRLFHVKLRKKGYFVEYGFGFDDAVQKIKNYMNLK